MYLKYFLESGIFAQDSKDLESRTLFYFVMDPLVGKDWHTTLLSVSIKDFTLNKLQPTTGSIARIA